MEPLSARPEMPLLLKRSIAKPLSFFRDSLVCPRFACFRGWRTVGQCRRKEGRQCNNKEYSYSDRPSTRPTLSQISSFKICGSNLIKFVVPLILSLENCEGVGRVAKRTTREEDDDDVVAVVSIIITSCSLAIVPLSLSWAIDRASASDNADKQENYRLQHETAAGDIFT